MTRPASRWTPSQSLPTRGRVERVAAEVAQSQGETAAPHTTLPPKAGRDREGGHRLALTRIGSFLATIAIASALAACTLTPAYQDGGPATIPLTYAQPNSRAEQLVYQRLAATLGDAANPSSALVSVKVSQEVDDLTRAATDNPRDNKQVVLTGNVTVTTSDGVVPTTVLSQSFTAAASFTTNGQLLADRAAEAEATERAAASLAETVRLALISRLPAA